MNTLRPSGPSVNTLASPHHGSDSHRRTVYSAAMQRLFGAPNLEAAMSAVSLQLVVAWTGLGPMALRGRCERAFEATARCIADHQNEAEIERLTALLVGIARGGR